MGWSSTNATVILGFIPGTPAGSRLWYVPVPAVRFNVELRPDSLANRLSLPCGPHLPSVYLSFPMTATPYRLFETFHIVLSTHTWSALSLATTGL